MLRPEGGVCMDRWPFVPDRAGASKYGFPETGYGLLFPSGVFLPLP